MPLRTLADKIELGQPSRGWPWQEAGIEREAKTCRQFITGLNSCEEDAAAAASELNRSCRPGERFGDSTSVRDSEIIDRRLARRRERVTRKPSLILPDRGDQNWLWKRSRLHGQVDSFRIAENKRPMFRVRASPSSPENSILFSSETDFAGRVKARPADRNFAGDGRRRAFTPAVILVIALPEAKDKLDPG